MNRRFNDDRWIMDFGDSFLVECPKCSRRATVIDRGQGFKPRILLTCAECGHFEEWRYRGVPVLSTFTIKRRHIKAGQITIRAAVDWYFHLPLWLQLNCCGETLWAYNERHLDFLESYVGAKLRERSFGEFGCSNKSLASRLPAWIKSAKNRPKIMKCLAKLREKLV